MTMARVPRTAVSEERLLPGWLGVTTHLQMLHPGGVTTEGWIWRASPAPYIPFQWVE